MAVSRNFTVRLRPEEEAQLNELATSTQRSQGDVLRMLVRQARASDFAPQIAMHKYDALIAAVFAEDDATRDRILARAKQLEAES